MKIMKIKKGELTTQQIVFLIILVASFAILLFFLLRLNLAEESRDQICHNSVVLSGNSKLAIGSLDCRTNYVCISGGEECEGINPTETKEVSLDKNEILKKIADEMASCWWMFGEGEIDYGGGGTETGVKYAICSIIAFDEKIQQKFSFISYDEFYNYLKTTKKTDSQTYLQYLYSTNVLENLDNNDYFSFSFLDNIDTKERYSIVTGVDKNLVDIIDDDEILKVYIIPSSEIKSKIKISGDFITKA